MLTTLIRPLVLIYLTVLLTLIIAPRADAVLEIREIEVTQGIQNLDNNVPLFTRRPTTARLYVFRSDFKPGNNITGRLVAAKHGGAPLNPSFIKCPDTVNTTNTYNPGAMREDDRMTLECPLPPSWVAFKGVLEFDAIVSSPLVPGPEPRKHVFFPVLDDHLLKIELIAIRDRCQGPCTAANGPTATEMRQAMSHIMDLFPVSRVNLVLSAGWIPMPRNENEADLMKNLYLGDTFQLSLSQKLPVAGKDRIRIGVLRAGATFLRKVFRKVGNTTIMELERYARVGAGSGETRVGYVVLGPNDPRISAAHEVGHCAGMVHIPDDRGCPFGTPPPACEAYPYNPIYLSDARFRDHYGWDNAFGGINPFRGDFMSYQDKRWVSDYTFLKIDCLLKNLTLPLWKRQQSCGHPAVEPPMSGSIVAKRLIWMSNSVTPLTPEPEFVDQVRTMVFSRNFLGSEESDLLQNTFDPNGSHAAILFGEDDGLLLNHRFTPIATHVDTEEVPVPFGQVSILLPYIEGVAKIRLVDLLNDRVLGEVEKSAAPPSVKVEDISDAVEGDELLLSWSADDPDGDALYASVLFSDDGGETWQPAVAGLEAELGRAYLDTTNWPGTDQGLLALLVSDGFHTSETILGPFAVPDKAPSLTLDGFEQREVVRGLPLEMRAFAFDPETGPLDGDAVHWRSSQDGFLGIGTSLWAPDLSSGRHEIEVTATDPEGQITTATLSFSVFNPRGPDRIFDDPLPENP